MKLFRISTISCFWCTILIYYCLTHNEQAKKAASAGTDAGARSIEHLEHRPPLPQPVLKAIKGQYLKNLPAKKGKLDVLQLASNRAQFKSPGKCLKEELSKDITVACFASYWHSKFVENDEAQHQVTTWYEGVNFSIPTRRPDL